MKLTDNIILKWGSDKLLHLFGAGWFVALFGMLSVYMAIVAEIIIILLSYLKEYKMDKYPDKKDIIAGTIGGGISVIICFLFTCI